MSFISNEWEISINSVCIIHVHTGIDTADIESGPFLVFLSLTK